MKKLDALRQFLTAYVPEFKTQPEKLQIYADAGNVIHRHGENLGFMYKLTVNVVVLEYSDDADTLILPMVLWLRSNERALFLNHTSGENNFKIEMDLLDAESRDIRLTFPLTESVDVLVKPNGTYETTHRNEAPAGGDELSDPAAVLKKIYVNGAQLVPEA